jgi:hypothetical protein
VNDTVMRSFCTTCKWRECVILYWIKSSNWVKHLCNSIPCFSNSVKLCLGSNRDVMWLSLLHADNHGCAFSRMVVVQFSSLEAERGGGYSFIIFTSRKFCFSSK